MKMDERYDRLNNERNMIIRIIDNLRHMYNESEVGHLIGNNMPIIITELENVLQVINNQMSVIDYFIKENEK